MDIGQRIITLRNERKMSQYALRNMTGISQGLLSDYESGKKKPGQENLKKICDALGITLSEFFDDNKLNNETSIWVSKQLKNMRTQRNYTQQDIADFLEIDISTYANYESGYREPDIATLLKLADFFSVSVDYLLRRDGSLQPTPPNKIQAPILSARDKALDQIKEANVNSRVKEIIPSSPDTVGSKEHCEDFDLKDYILSVIREHESEKDCNNLSSIEKE